KRINCAALVNWPPEREVNDTDVILALQLYGLLDRRDDGAVGTCAILVKNSQIEKVGIRCDAFENVQRSWHGRGFAIARENAGYVRSVSVIVVLNRSADEAFAINNARRARVRRPEVRMRVDPAVNYRNAHSGSAQSCVPRHGCVDGVAGVVQRCIDGTIE